MQGHLWTNLTNPVYLYSSCQGWYALYLESETYFKRVKKEHFIKNINLHLVLAMRGCFVSFILTFRNLCKSALAYSPEFVIFCFLLPPYFPSLFLYVSLKLFFPGLWGFYWYHFTFWWNSRFSKVSSKLHISFKRGCIPAVSIFSYVE